MALTYTARGNSTHNTSSSTLVITPASNFATNSFAVLVVNYDNSGTSGADPYSSITDSVGNTWTSRAAANRTGASSNDGVSLRIFTSPMNVSALTTSNTITINFSPNTTAKIWRLQQVAPSAGNQVRYISQNATTGSSTTPTITTVAIRVGQMVIGGWGDEYGTAQTPTHDSDSTNGSWTAAQYSEVGTTTTGQSGAAQTKVQTTANSTQTFNATLGTSADWAIAYIILGEVFNAWSQAQSKIKAVAVKGYAQANTAIASKYSYAQANAKIKITNIEAYAQSQTYIKLIAISYAQAQVSITTGTTTVFNDTSASRDVYSSNATYSTARTGGTLGIGFTDTDRSNVGQYVSGSPYYCIEGFYNFDTSTIGSGSTILLATLSLYYVASPITNFTVNARLDDWGPTLETGDWISGASLSGQTLLAHLDTTGKSTGGYIDFTNDELVANINKTGATGIILSSDRHEAGTQPGGSEYASFYTSNHVGSPAKLTVIYTTSGITTINSFAQSQTNIEATSRSYAQSQTWIEAVSTVYAQSQADIKQTYRGYAQSLADIKQVSKGYAQVQAVIKQFSLVASQANAKIKAIGILVSAQAQVDIKQTYISVAQVNVRINTVNFIYAQSLARIKGISKAYAQAQANIKQNYFGVAQANAYTKTTGIINVAQAQVKIKQFYLVNAQAQAKIKAIGVLTVAQTQAKIFYSGLIAAAQSQVKTKTTYIAYSQVQTSIRVFNVIQVAQAQSTIRGLNNAFAQLSVWIKSNYLGYAQSQTDIKFTSRVYAQSQADIKQVYIGIAQSNVRINATLTAVAQSKALIRIKSLVIEDHFGDRTISGWGTPDTYGPAYTSVSGGSVVENGTGKWAEFTTGQPQTQRMARIPVTVQDAEIFYKFKFSEDAGVNQYIYPQLRHISGNNRYYASIRISTTDLKLYVGIYKLLATVVTGAIDSGVTAEIDEWIKVRFRAYGTNPTFLAVKVWNDGTSEPDTWTVTGLDSEFILQAAGGMIVASTVLADSTLNTEHFHDDIYGYDLAGNSWAQVQADIKQTYIIFAQALAVIKLSNIINVAQAQSRIKQSYRGVAQSQFSIRQVYIAVAQSQTRILTSYQGVAQSQVTIKALYTVFAQSATTIKQVYQGFAQTQAKIFYSSLKGYAQSQVWIKQISFNAAQSQVQIRSFGISVFAQTQAQIGGLSRVFAQAQAKIKAFGITAFAQVQTDIKKAYIVAAQSQTDVVAAYQVFAQSQAKIVSTYTRVAQSQSKIKAIAVKSYAQSNVDIKATYRVYAQSLTDIINKYHGYGQAQVRIIQTSLVVSQSQTRIKSINQIFAQSIVSIKTTNQAFAQSQVKIFTIQRSFAQSNVCIKLEALFGFAQSQSKVKAISLGFAQSLAYIRSGNLVLANAQGLIKATVINYAQAVVQIKTTYNAYANVTTLIQTTFIASAQAQVAIKQAYTQVAQAQTFIIKAMVFGQAQTSIRLVHQLWKLEISDSMEINLELSSIELNLGISDSILTEEMLQEEVLQLELSDSVGINLTLSDTNYDN